ncbi:ABC transporter permease protein [Gottschalkia purinilytica]|uniref:ABC transporter permease protein n=1 Tax=Gottschalkia purinilytica TaxID=1503 RepID=A0A0L0W9Z9_GOTPU|nr:FtsX-like permease family protein [Gottschalkia purinilytica]KNF08267.1 ABC transporter permease protein [Gottschalkia purinilytica]
MNTISNLVRKNLKSYKIRNTLVLLTIIFATCLITSIGILSKSINQMMINQIVRQTGSAHGKYKNLNDKQFGIIKNNLKFEKVGEYIKLGNSRIKESEDGYISLIYADKNTAHLMNMDLEKGKLPQKSNEVALEKWVIKELNLKPKIGETIKLKYGKSLNDDSDRKISDEKELTFILTGILKDNINSKQSYNSLGIVSRDLVLRENRNEDIKSTAYVKLKSNKNIEENINMIGRSIALDKKNISVNTDYINILKTDFESLIPFIIVGVIVIFATIIVIYNIFNISIVERVNQLGLLSALGSTKGQLRKIIFKEGIILSVISIPIGIILGHVISFLLIPLLNLDELKGTFSPYIILVSALVSFITVFLALIKPSKIASRISPIESIRYNNVDIKRKRKKGYDKVSIKNIAYLNLWRNKKRTIITILSLTMSGVLFILFSTVLNSMNVDSLTKGYINNDFHLTSDRVHLDDKSDPLNETLINYIKGLEGIKKMETLKYYWVYVKNNKGLIKLSDGSTTDKLNSVLYGYEESALKELRDYLIEGEISIENLKSKNEVLAVARSEGESSYKVGDKVILEITERDEKGTIIKEIKKEVLISGIVNSNVRWIGYSGLGDDFITHQDTFGKITEDERVGRLYIDVNKDKYEEVNNALKSIVDKNDKIKYMSYKEYREEREKELRGVKVISMSLVSIIGLIGMFNLVNTMITSIFTRRKELGMLQAVGLSNTQMRKMLQIEGLYYAAISTILSVPTGIGLGYAFYILFKKSATYATYKFPLIQTILVIIMFTLTQILVTYIIEKNIRKDSIVDRIRYNE